MPPLKLAATSHSPHPRRPALDQCLSSKAKTTLSCPRATAARLFHDNRPPSAPGDGLSVRPADPRNGASHAGGSRVTRVIPSAPTARKSLSPRQRSTTGTGNDSITSPPASPHKIETERLGLSAATAYTPAARSVAV